jgi:UDP-2,3-diacylglucosamine hydrolase
MKEPGKKIYFISDFHLGVPDHKSSLLREKAIIQWLNEIKKDAEQIFILGDVFDFWFEYKTVVPKGFVRLLGKLAEICDEGIPVHFFIGNHDMWSFEYFPKEIGLKQYSESIQINLKGKNFFIGHGDGLGPGDKGYKFLRKIFRNPLLQKMFGWIHPDVGIRIADYWSRKSRKSTKEDKFLGEDKEWLVLFCKDQIKQNPKIDYFIFGHRHLPLDIELSTNSRYINLGDWISFKTYAVFDGDKLELKTF